MKRNPAEPPGRITAEDPAVPAIDGKTRALIIAATLLALFLGAMDALVMSAAMPTIVAELGGLHLYSWVYSAYLLARAVSLPLFGKLADIYKSKTLIVISIGIFIAASIGAGLARSMAMLIFFRTIQGIGAGGNFALVYIILSDISTPETRGKTLSMGSFIWGLASVLGPSLGGFIVSYFSWRWIFFINLPLGCFSLIGIAAYLKEIRPKKGQVVIDFLGAAFLTATILALLTAFLLGGRTYAWTSVPIAGLLLAFIAAGVAFYFTETRAPSPILSMDFFKIRGFSVGNAAVFLSSFVIFSLFAFAPLFIQAALAKSPMAVGVAMLSLSLGWSLGALAIGQTINRIGKRPAAVAGAFGLIAGAVGTLFFTTSTGMATCFVIFFITGAGMGFVTLSTLMVVQNSLPKTDLGVATSTHQFARTLGGTIGVGVSGSLMTWGLSNALARAADAAGGPQIPAAIFQTITQNLDSLLRPGLQARLEPEIRLALQEAVSRGSDMVFWCAVLAAFACLFCCLLLPREVKQE